MSELENNNPLFRAMARLGDLVVFSVLWAAVLPAGGDSGGIHPGAVCRGLRQEVTSRKEFLKAFKRDWKQAVATWLPMLALLALLVLDVSVGAQFPVP